MRTGFICTFSHFRLLRGHAIPLKQVPETEDHVKAYGHSLVIIEMFISGDYSKEALTRQTLCWLPDHFSREMNVGRHVLLAAAFEFAHGRALNSILSHSRDISHCWKLA
jgi:hypothetical protein